MGVSYCKGGVWEGGAGAQHPCLAHLVPPLLPHLTPGEVGKAQSRLPPPQEEAGRRQLLLLTSLSASLSSLPQAQSSFLCGIRPAPTPSTSRWPSSFHSTPPLSWSCIPARSSEIFSEPCAQLRPLPSVPSCDPAPQLPQPSCCPTTSFSILSKSSHLPRPPHSFSFPPSGFQQLTLSLGPRRRLRYRLPSKTLLQEAFWECFLLLARSSSPVPETLRPTSSLRPTLPLLSTPCRGKVRETEARSWHGAPLLGTLMLW